MILNDPYLGKTVLNPDNLDRFKSVLATMNKATYLALKVFSTFLFVVLDA